MFAIVMIAILTVVSVGVAILGGVVNNQRRVAVAADLAALAGADAVQHGAGGCAAARTIAVRNGGQLRTCQIAGEVLTLSVAREVDIGFGKTVTVRAAARAGPR